MVSHSPELLMFAETASDDRAPRPPSGDVGQELARLPDAPVRVGRFSVLYKLGEGGMSLVYAAHDEILDRRVALKKIKPRSSVDSSRLRERLIREARALARLSHPNVVPIYHAELLGAEMYLAMELVPGNDLRSWLQTPLADRADGSDSRTVEQTLAVFGQIGQGLAAAHEAGVVHRDFKPANVFMGTDGRPRIGDFGLARTTVANPQEDVETTSADPLAADSHELTADGALLGTPAYMAPEQLQRLPATEASDQFSFCAVLCEALYGKRPYRENSLQAQLQAMNDRPIAALPDRPEVPLAVREALLRGLRFDPDERWPSMQELVVALSPDAVEMRESDTSVARRERVRLILGLATLAIVISAIGQLVQLLFPHLQPYSPDGILALQLASTPPIVGAVFLARQALRQNRFNRQLAALLIVTQLSMTISVAGGVAMGMDPGQLALGSEMILGTLCAFYAVTISSQLWLMAVEAALAIIATVYFPEHATWISQGLVLVICATAITLWLRGSRTNGDQERAAEPPWSTHPAAYRARARS